MRAVSISRIPALTGHGRRFAAAAGPRASWVDHEADCDFPLQNLPFGVFSCSRRGPRCATAIGGSAVDLAAVAEAGLFADLPFNAAATFRQPVLNSFMGLDRSAWRATRARLTELFAADGDDRLKRDESLRAAALRPLHEVKMHLPAQIGDYTDFYASREHATNVGIMFRGVDNALQPNWLHLPVGYHGRASSVVVSGTPVVRPRGQRQKDMTDAAQGSVYGESIRLDYELEIGMFVGGATPPIGRPITAAEAAQHVFGYVILNDWSSRDHQPWEYIPLGPFTAKNFASTISPWIVTPDALEPFTCATSAGAQTDPVPLPYLQDPSYTSYDLKLFVDLKANDTTTNIAESNFRHMYWTPRQQLVHHSVTGCPMHPGDLLGSGTISGTIGNSGGKSINYGSLLEQSWKGSNKITLKDGSERSFILDNDTITMRGFCQGEGYRVGFGECAGEVVPAGSADSAAPAARKAASAGSQLSNFTLRSYWRSSCSWRVRIALAHHGVAFETLPVNLLEGGQKAPEFLSEQNAMGQLPALTFTDAAGVEHTLTQSLAIIDFLDAAFAGELSAASLVPPADGSTEGALLRARALQIAEVINSGIQPLQNLDVLKKVKVAVEDGAEVDGRGFGKAVQSRGLAAVEALVAAAGGRFAAGDVVSVADAALAPQLYNARRFDVDLSPFPNLLRVEAACAELPAFKVAHPDAQPDAVA